MPDRIPQAIVLWTVVVLLLAYILPNHYAPWLSFHQELAAAAAFAPLALWQTARSTPIPPIALVAGIVALIPLLQIATGQIHFSTDGWMGYLYLMGFALAAHAGAQFRWPAPLPDTKSTTAPPIEAVWSTLLVAALFSAGIALHQWLLPGYQGIFIVEIPPESRPFGNLAQPNQLATLLFLGMAGLIYLWESRRVCAPCAIVAISLLLLALAMTGSRSVLLAFIWLLPAYALMRKQCHLRTSPATVMAAASFYIFMMWAWPALDERLLLDTGASSALERMGTPGIRWVMWQAMLDAISAAPFFGYGWGQISIAQIAVTLDHPPTHLLLESSHNLFIDLALWNGVPIALLVMAALVWWFVDQVRRCDDGRKWASLMGVTAVFSHAMVEYPLSYAYFLLPVGFFMGALSHAQSQGSLVSKLLPTPRIIRRIMIGIGISTASLTASVAIEYFPIEADWSLMRFQEARIGNLEMTEPPPALVLTGLQQFLRFSRSEPRLGMTHSELEFMRRNSERFAYAAPMFKYAVAQAINHQPQGAANTLRKLCSMHSLDTCHSAKKQWHNLAENRYPDLLAPFPEAVNVHRKD